MFGGLGRPIINRVLFELDFLALDIALENKRTGSGNLRPARLDL